VSPDRGLPAACSGVTLLPLDVRSVTLLQRGGRA